MPTTSRSPQLTRPQARRIALAAQGFGRARPSSLDAADPGVRTMNIALQRMAALQIDSVNVFARSHYLPLFSRLGPYDTARLDRLVLARGGPYTEYRAHEAAFIPRRDWGLFAFRMRAMRDKYGPGTDGFVEHHAPIVQWVRDELAARGPLRPAEFDHELRRVSRGPWWDWDAVKNSLEYLWLFGEVAIAGRRGFERVYALAEQVIPDQERTEVPRDDAIRELVRRAARASGVATASDLADYWRIRDRGAILGAVSDLVDAHELEPVRVIGWERAGRSLPAWRHRDAKLSRRIEGATILTPFDPVVWFRERAQRLFDFDYRIEIYTPAAQRRYGYYSLPVLRDDDVVGRVDLKADRARSTLRVQSAWWEQPAAEAAHPREDVERIADALRSAARWQGLESISVGRWGDAADDLASVLGGERHERVV
ncbi:winged helix-turn-helix domain-containing protein [Microbacterium sp.]|uniref:winged helix-turn-helix domain-containing protein n=1 Tax=Microbacterium sp. TaxID=51671 RepID=UPI003C74A0EA